MAALLVRYQWRTRVLVCSVVVVFSATPVPSSAGQDPPPLLSFGSSTKIATTWEKLENGSKVELFSDATEGLDVQVVVTALTSQSARVEAADTLSVSQSESQLPPGRSMQIVLKRKTGAAIADGTYVARLVAFVPDVPRAFAQLPLTLTVGSAKIVPEPAVGKLSVTVFRWMPFEWDRYPRPDDISLILKAEKEDVAGSELLDLGKTPLGVVSKGDRGAPVRWDGDIERASGGLAAIGLDISRLGRTGTYAGTLDLIPDDKEVGAVEATVVYKDLILLPLLVLLAGVGLGSWASRAAGVSGPYFSLRARIVALGGTLKDARTSFAKSAGRHPWKSATIDEAVATAQSDLETRAKDLRDTHHLKIPEEDVKELYEAIEAAKGLIAGFATYGETLKVLQAERDRILKPDKPDELPQPAGLAKEPKLLDELDTALRPPKFLRLDQIETEKEAAATAIIYASGWRELQNEIRDLQVWLNSFDEPTKKANASHVQDAQDSLDQLYMKLWNRTDKDDLDDKEWHSELTQVESDLNKVKRTKVESVPATVDESSSLDTFGVDGTAGTSRDRVTRERPKRPKKAKFRPAKPPSDPARDWAGRTAEFISSGDRRRRAAFGIATAVALVTGLDALYFGHAFGSGWDYLKLLVWGATTKLVVDLVIAGFDAMGFARVIQR